MKACELYLTGVGTKTGASGSKEVTGVSGNEPSDWSQTWDGWTGQPYFDSCAAGSQISAAGAYGQDADLSGCCLSTLSFL